MLDKFNKNKPKIAIIGLKGLPAFGGAASTSELVLDELKNSIEFYVYSIDSHTEKRGFWNGYTQIVFKRSPIKYLNTLVYYLKSVIHSLIKENYDLVHVNHLAFGIFVPLLKIKYRVIGTDRGLSWLYQRGKGNKWNLIELLIFRINKFFFVRFVDTLVTVSKEYEQYYNKYRSDTVVINNGIRIDLETMESKIIQGEYILFAAGRIIELKGCHLLLSALKQLSYKGKLKIIGNLEHSMQYKDRIKLLSEGLDVDFIGLIKEKKKLFEIIRNSKLFIFPSLSEGMSNMLLEVASQMTPLIVSDIPENAAVFSNEEVLFFKSNDVDDLANKILFSFSHSELMKKKSELAYQRVKKDYNIEIISKQYEFEYKKLMGL